jgi:hypothetical protein
VKDYKPSAWKENIEVIFVAVVIAMGIRAYFIQQFKIPTGSMQPTLNGIIAYPTKEMNPLAERHAPDDYESPALPQRLWDKVWYGRSHVEWVAEEDDVVITDWIEAYCKKDPRPQKTSRFVCSAFIGYIYTKLTLLPEDTDWSILYPSYFSSENPGLSLLHDAHLSPEEIIHNQPAAAAAAAADGRPRP